MGDGRHRPRNRPGCTEPALLPGVSVAWTSNRWLCHHPHGLRVSRCWHGRPRRSFRRRGHFPWADPHSLRVRSEWRRACSDLCCCWCDNAGADAVVGERMASFRVNKRVVAVLAGVVIVLASYHAVTTGGFLSSNQHNANGNSDFRLDNSSPSCNRVIHLSYVGEGGQDGSLCISLNNVREVPVLNITVASDDLYLCVPYTTFGQFTCNLRSASLCLSSNVGEIRACGQLSNHAVGIFVRGCRNSTAGLDVELRISVNYTDGYSSTIYPRFQVIS